jgi:Xaa-Pro aminopeptidase
METAMSETSEKVNQIRNLAAKRGLNAVLLQRVSSVAWATCGASTYVNTARSNAEVALLITNDKQYLLTNNIEAPRLEKEEQLISQGWDFQITPWFEHAVGTKDLTRRLNLGSDYYFPDSQDLSEEVARLRANLTQEEGERFRILGRLCGEAMATAIKSVHPGQTEYEIASLLACEAEQRGVQAIVNLIAVDERIFNFRHPLPTDRKLDHYAMLVLCGRRWGLVCSVTRLVYYGKLPEELRVKSQAVARVDAAMMAATRPGQTLGQVFACAQSAYAEAGYPEEWRLHHQGGPAGYEPRELIATPASTETVVTGQVYAWNPSITGCKSEDSILIGEDGFEVLSAVPGWPVIKVELANKIIDRPDILEVN